MFYSFSPSFRLLCCICAVRSDVETIERERRMPSGHVAQGEAGGEKDGEKKEEEGRRRRRKEKRWVYLGCATARVNLSGLNT